MKAELDPPWRHWRVETPPYGGCSRRISRPGSGRPKTGWKNYRFTGRSRWRRRPAEFFLRDRWLRAHFACVDRFVAPSRFLRQRYLEWGIAAEDVVLIDYGRSAAGRPPADAGPATEKRNRFGFFGQLIDCKGLDCLIDAVAQLVRNGICDFELRVHGANLQNASEALQKRFAMAIESFPQFKFLGSYFSDEGPRHAAAVDWFVVPSIWWENSPLVIQEAFMAGRPVLCSNLGGMAEKGRDGVDGLHFAVGDAASQNTLDRVRLLL
jgi:glycosyltransferase involved in cell wall biosynthesis